MKNIVIIIIVFLFSFKNKAQEINLFHCSPSLHIVKRVISDSIVIINGPVQVMTHYKLPAIYATLDPYSIIEDNWWVEYIYDGGGTFAKCSTFKGYYNGPSYKVKCQPYSCFQNNTSGMIIESCANTNNDMCSLQILTNTIIYFYDGILLN